MYFKVLYVYLYVICSVPNIAQVNAQFWYIFSPTLVVGGNINIYTTFLQ